MRKTESTEPEVVEFAKLLTNLLGEEQVMAVARRSGWLRRLRKVQPLMMVAAVLSTLGAGSAKWLADILRTFVKFTGIPLQYKPFHNQLAKKKFPEMLRMLTEEAMTSLTRPALHAVSPKLKRFKDIILHDGTSFALKDSLQTDWPGRFSKVSPAAVELHVTMSLLEDEAHSVTLAADAEAERQHRPDPASLRDCLFMADRGYQERKFFYDVDQAGGFFIVRGTKSIRPLIRGAFDACGKPIRKLVGKTLTWDLLPRQSVDLDIEWAFGSLVYRGRIVAIYRPGKRNEKAFVYLHTNLSRKEFTAQDIGNLYRLRWQVELLFKEYKSHTNLHAFDTGKAAIAEAMIWASLLAALLKRAITHCAERIVAVDLSTQRAAASGKHYLDTIFRALLGSQVQKSLRRAIARAVDYLSENARRAHPNRDRERGRLSMGLEPTFGA